MAVRMMGVIVLALVAGPPCSEPVKTADETTVTVCIDLPASLPWGARVLASRMLGREGVRIEWRSMDDCRGLTGAIELRFSDDTTPYADTLAFAEPYQGTHIVVYTDRVQAIQKSKCGSGSHVMAHVLVHEITHMLQGTDWHSTTGIMKARWDQSDYFAMRSGPLPFSPEDVDLIREGIKARSRTMAERWPTSAP